MQVHWWWWGLAVLFAVLEMVTATFFFLVLGVGLAAGGAVAFGGGGLAAQLIAAAVVSVLAWYLLRRFAPRRGRVAAQGSRDLLLDVGERVRVERWQPDRRAKVVYRGAQWDAELATDDERVPEPGEYVIRRIEGNRLILARGG